MSRLIWLLVAALIAGVAYGGQFEDAGAQDTTGVVSVQKYYCTYLDETLLVEAIDVNECAPGAATFSFYLIGDGTAEYQQLVVGANGQGSIELPVGSYEMVEEGTQTFFTVSVIAGQPTNLLIGNPASDVVPTVPAPQPTAVPTAPIGLPNTGSGASPDSNVLSLALMALGVTSFVAGAGAFVLRRDAA